MARRARASSRSTGTSGGSVSGVISPLMVDRRERARDLERSSPGVRDPHGAHRGDDVASGVRGVVLGPPLRQLVRGVSEASEPADSADMTREDAEAARQVTEHDLVARGVALDTKRAEHGLELPEPLPGFGFRCRNEREVVHLTGGHRPVAKNHLADLDQGCESAHAGPPFAMRSRSAAIGFGPAALRASASRAASSCAARRFWRTSPAIRAPSSMSPRE